MMPYTMEKIIVQPKFINPQYHKQKLTKSCILMRKQIHSFQILQKKTSKGYFMYISTQLSSSKWAKIGKIVLQSYVLWKEKNHDAGLFEDLGASTWKRSKIHWF